MSAQVVNIRLDLGTRSHFEVYLAWGQGERENLEIVVSVTCQSFPPDFIADQIHIRLPILGRKLARVLPVETVDPQDPF